MSVPESEARERVLDAAEKLFMERGYAAVTLQDIAKALGMRQASLYYHVPGGKEALFIEVMERTLRRHEAGLRRVIAGAGDDLHAQLGAAARWLLSQPNMNYGRMMQSDMPAIDPVQAERLAWIAYNALLMPLRAVFERALDGSDPHHAGYLSGAFLSMIESIHFLPAAFLTDSKEAIAGYLIDVLIGGLNRRS
jgi:AcrR family transcriptional regulator